ncbi:MAG: DUF2147 domain-containing protein [Allosphingosinicella sp.]
MQCLRNITRVLLPPLALALAAPAAAAPASIQGLWLNDDHKGLIQIAPCGGKLCGTIVKVLDRAPNAPKTDIHNPDPALRNRPFTGLPVLTGFEGSGGSWKNGRAYDPESGKSYRSYLELQPDGSLKVSGCILFVCQSKRWTRAR